MHSFELPATWSVTGSAHEADSMATADPRLKQAEFLSFVNKNKEFSSFQ